MILNILKFVISKRKGAELCFFKSLWSCDWWQTCSFTLWYQHLNRMQQYWTIFSSCTRVFGFGLVCFIFRKIRQTIDLRRVVMKIPVKFKPRYSEISDMFLALLTFLIYYLSGKTLESLKMTGKRQIFRTRTKTVPLSLNWIYLKRITFNEK